MIVTPVILLLKLPGDFPAEFQHLMAAVSSQSDSKLKVRNKIGTSVLLKKELNSASVQFSSVPQSCLTFCNPMDCSTLGFPVHHLLQSLLKPMSIELGMPSIVSHPLLLPPSIFPSIRVFSNEPVLHSSQPKYWSLSFSISPSNVYSGLISFRIDWFDLLAIQVTFKSLLQHHSSKASILQRSAFFSPTHIHT